MENYTLITGASRGIGCAVALRLAKEARNLILTADKDEKGLLKTQEQVSRIYMENFGPAGRYMNCKTIICDVSDSAAVRRMYDSLEKNGCFIEALINNAGISCFKLVQDMTDDDWNRVMGVNLDGIFYMCRGAVPNMIKKKKGFIINISSYWGVAGSATESAYCASKGGVNAFTLSLAKELAPSNIKVNAVICEFIDTKMNSFLNKEEINAALEEMPAHRIISASEIADIVFSLLNEENSVSGRLIEMKKL